jgi:hypothetical protein
VLSCEAQRGSRPLATPYVLPVGGCGANKERCAIRTRNDGIRQVATMCLESGVCDVTCVVNCAVPVKGRRLRRSGCDIGWSQSGWTVCGSSRRPATISTSPPPLLPHPMPQSSDIKSDHDNSIFILQSISTQLTWVTRSGWYCPCMIERTYAAAVGNIYSPSSNAAATSFTGTT